MRVEHSPSVHGGGVQGYTPQKNQSSHGGWDSVNGPVSPRRDILRDLTRTYHLLTHQELSYGVPQANGG